MRSTAFDVQLTSHAATVVPHEPALYLKGQACLNASNVRWMHHGAGARTTPKKLLMMASRPSTAEAEGAKEAVDEKVVQMAAAAEGQAGSQTGLGVAGMLRRIGLWAKEDAARGRITINGRELLRWKRAADRCWPFPDRLPPSCVMFESVSPYIMPYEQPGKLKKNGMDGEPVHGCHCHDRWYAALQLQ